MVDVGGGFGEQAIMLAREGFRVTGSDPDPDMLAMVKSRIQTLEEKRLFTDEGVVPIGASMPG